MRRITIALAAVLFAAALLLPATAGASCRTHSCWQRVHVHHLERMVEARIDRITPFTCYGFRSVKPCWVITQESATSGFWRAYNPSGAEGIYQLLGHGQPWPVIVTWGPRLWRKYETLKRMLAHHRIARSLPDSAWGR